MKKNLVNGLWLCAGLFLTQSTISLAGTQSSSVACLTPPVETVQNYGLIDALLHARSRRFFAGAEMPGGPLKYSSQLSAKRLTLKEEALLAFAAVGISGFALGELPYQSGVHGGGNMMIQFVGRTIPSGDSGQFTSVLIINDEGVWYLRRGAEMNTDELKEVLALNQEGRFVEAYQKMRVKVLDHRPDISHEPNVMVTVNTWSASRPGTTYFVPVIDMSSAFVANAFYFMNSDPNVSFMILDEKNRFKSAGLDKHLVSKGGVIADDAAKKGRVVNIGFMENILSQLLSVEAGAMIQNLRLMTQALGLGGFPHSAGVPGAWLGALGFSQEDVPYSKISGVGFFDSLLMKWFGYDISLPSYLGLEVNGQSYMKSYSPHNYGSVERLVRAFVAKKFGPKGIYFPGAEDRTAWKSPDEIRKDIKGYSEKQISAVIDFIKYVQDRYGRFPTITGPLSTNVAFQAHVIDPQFYDNFYKSEALTEVQRCRSSF